MKKFPVAAAAILAVVAAIIFILINKDYIIKIAGEKSGEESEAELEPGETLPEDETKNARDYFPVLSDVKYTYTESGSGLISEVSVDYSSDDAMQLRIVCDGSVKTAVLAVREGEVFLTHPQKEEYFRQNIMNSWNEGDIILKEPIEEGTQWPVKGGTRKITSLSASVKTPEGMFDAVQVTTFLDGRTVTDYYSRGLGLVKSEIREEASKDEAPILDQEYSSDNLNSSTAFVLNSIQKNYVLTEEINYYFPDFKKMKVRSSAKKTKFHTNDITEQVLTHDYRNVVYGDRPVLSNNSSINKVDVDLDNTLHVDLSSGFVDDMDVEAIYEGMILQSIANTMGRFFNAEQVRFTVESEDYRSQNIRMHQRPMKVSYLDFPLYFDVVVYGATAAGVMAAVSAAREGMDVALIESAEHVGGMVTGGLSYTDHGNINVIGGITREFFEDVGKKYGRKVMWYYEPHVAEEVLNEMIERESIRLFTGSALRDHRGVDKDGSTIISMETEKGDVFFAQYFIDSTYEGDMMAASGVSYAVGREDNDDFGESFAGVLPPLGRNNFYYNLKAEDAEGKLYGEVSLKLPGPAGQGDDMVQAYNYRLILTNNPNNQIPFTKPGDYDRERYLLLSSWLDMLKKSEGRSIRFSDVAYFGPLPEGKYDINNSGPFSTDYIGGSLNYPEAGYEQREEIKNEHKNYIQGLLYFIGNDEAVPTELREDVKKWGYAADEFTDNGCWPYQLYIREARRMKGDFVMTEHDVRRDKIKDDVIAMGSYNIDSHNVQRYMTLDGFVLNEGEIQIPVTPYQIPYRVMLPKRSQADNLLVTVCVSATHIAYSSLRMEPQYMMMGEAAGIAASLSVKQRTEVQNIDVAELQKILVENGAVFKTAE